MRLRRRSSTRRTRRRARKRRGADRREDPQRAEDRDHLQQDQEEAGRRPGRGGSSTTPARCAGVDRLRSARCSRPSMNASVVVVGVEKPFGSRWRNSSEMHSRRAARNPEVRSGIVLFGEVARHAVQHRRCRAGALVACVRAIARRPRDRRRRDARRAAPRPTVDAGRRASTIRMNVPVAWRMPVLTAAPLPLLVRMTHGRAPGSRRLRPGVVGRAIVDDEDLVPRRRRRISRG